MGFLELLCLMDRMSEPLGDRSNVYSNPPPSRLRKPKFASRINGADQSSGTGARGADEVIPTRSVGSRRRAAAQQSVTARPVVQVNPRPSAVRKANAEQVKSQEQAPLDLVALEERMQKQLEERVQLQLAASEIRMKEALVNNQTEAMRSSTQAYEALKNSSSSLQEDRVRLSNEISLLNAERERLQRKNAEEEQRSYQLRKELSEEKSRCHESNVELDQYRRRVDDLMHRCESAESRCREFDTQLRELGEHRRVLEAAETRCRMMEADLRSAEEARRNLESNSRRLESEVEQCTSRSHDLNRKVLDREGELDKMRNTLRSVERDLKMTEQRLADCEQDRSNAQDALTSYRSRMEVEMNSLRTACQFAEDAKHGTETKLNAAQEETRRCTARIMELETQGKKTEADLIGSQGALEQETNRADSLKSEKEKLEKIRARLETDLEASQNETVECRRTINTQDSATTILRAKIAAMEDELRSEQDKLRKEEALRSELEGRCAEQEQQIRDDEMTRRKLHNLVQELKGNIRVYCRIRPALTADERADTVLHTTKGKTGLDAIQPKASIAKGEPLRWNFQFDQVFGPEATQGAVFDEVSQVVQSALDGYRVCLFAYGQTGSGKTHTMLGGSSTDVEQFGVIPRSIRLVFEQAEKLKAQDWTFSLKASFLEIYNESIRDLLCRGPDTKPHVIKLVDGKTGDVYVTDLTSEEVTSPDQVQALITRSVGNRATAATNCNERSSRSHSVFRLHIEGSNDVTRQNLKGMLNLIDLAGSERLNSSGSTGDRLKETQHINKSLSALGKLPHPPTKKLTPVYTALSTLSRTYISCLDLIWFHRRCYCISRQPRKAHSVPQFEAHPSLAGFPRRGLQDSHVRQPLPSRGFLP